MNIYTTIVLVSKIPIHYAQKEKKKEKKTTQRQTNQICTNENTYNKMQQQTDIKNTFQTNRKYENWKIIIFVYSPGRYLKAISVVYINFTSLHL